MQAYMSQTGQTAIVLSPDCGEDKVLLCSCACWFCVAVGIYFGFILASLLLVLKTLNGEWVAIIVFCFL